MRLKQNNNFITYIIDFKYIIIEGCLMCKPFHNQYMNLHLNFKNVRFQWSSIFLD